MQSFSQVSERREETFVAGLSMAGYGTMKWALRQQGRFAAAASLLGALDIAGSTTSRVRPREPQLTRRLFGETPVSGRDTDPMHLVAHADPGALPALRLWFGSEDGLLVANHRCRDACTAEGVGVELKIGPGKHDWDYWDAEIQDVLAWFAEMRG